MQKIYYSTTWVRSTQNLSRTFTQRSTIAGIALQLHLLQDLNEYWVFSARCNIYISRLCYDMSVRLSLCDGSELAHYS